MTLECFPYSKFQSPFLRGYPARFDFAIRNNKTIQFQSPFLRGYPARFSDGVTNERREKVSIPFLTGLSCKFFVLDFSSIYCIMFQSPFLRGYPASVNGLTNTEIALTRFNPLSYGVILQERALQLEERQCVAFAKFITSLKTRSLSATTNGDSIAR